MPKSVCFDVLGTCFGFEGAIDVIESRLGSRLRSVHADSKSVFFLWFFAAQRDFTYTSLAGSYTPIAAILKATFKRACAVVDVPPEEITDDDVAAVMAEVKRLRPRPGLKNCYDGLRDAGWDVYGVTNGGKETSLTYYELADIQLDGDHLLSCDEIQVAKPDVKVYETAHRHLTKRGLGMEGDGDRWFVAAHAWDLIAARKAGFKTAYLTFEEHDPVTEVFGRFDVYADSMEELLGKLKAV
ncbi:Haloacid dehalogenase-like protein [Dothistroma septosporum NZE10]|uniref:Haloacid dehalogenase-like protein n=1 Tax=Dothistroma septosporum (strain NZE10 / CBS 128990) TaxID=675120 RepID=N1PFX7_DOTSN|nr:Haloacid dehalogenase-like protein [Dothistroma septosporum NZE10]